MRKLTYLFLIFSASINAQNVFWFEDFDNGAATRWDVTGDHPTPAGITGLVYGVNGATTFDYFIINDANTPELDGPIVNGLSISSQGQFVRGHHYDCSSPSDLPNPFVNTGGTNNSLHLTARAGCPGLIYAGTPGYDDWNCLTITGNDAPADLTQTEQYAAYNSNIDATGQCNIKLTADFFTGGSANGLEAHSTILYSVDGGTTWEIVQDNLATCIHSFAGTCNNWNRRTFELPANADNQPDLRIAFRWYEDANTNDNTQDYTLGGSFNVDNVMLSACSKPNTDFFSTSITTICKNSTIRLESEITPSSGTYLNCFTALTDNCDVTGYLWTITKTSGGTPVTITYVDGTSATDANPHIQFDGNGTFTVELTASTCGGDSTISKTDFITVVDCPPSSNFIVSKTTVCTEPTAKLDTVTFTDLSTTPSTAITTWAWTFNPATVTYVNATNSSSQNPQVTFDATGTYEVTLQVTNSEGSDSETKTAYVEAISCECGGVGGGGPINVFSEDFDNNGGAGSNWSTLNEDIGAQGDIPSTWWISDQEDGNAAGVCGSSGSGDASLHVSTCACYIGDVGAAYEIGAGFCGFIAGVCPISDKRSYSNSISTVGATNLVITFNYIEGGEGTTDDALLIYSINDGASWLTLDNPAKTAICGSGQGRWTAYNFNLPATCEGITTLRIGFRWYNNDGGGVDPSFAVDDISIDGTSGGGGAVNTWNGATSNDWHTASNWSDNAVPTSTDDVLVPAPADLVGTFMPTISAAAVADNVCNFGTITLTGDYTLTIDSDLLNEGVVTTTTTTNTADVIFANSASLYKGAGTMYDVDVAVTSSDLTLETDLTARSLIISTTGTVDIDIYDLSLNKNLTKTAGTFIATNGVINFIDACGSCVDATSNADVAMNANQSFGDVYVTKTTGVITSLVSNVNYAFATPKTLTIESGILDANTNTLNGNGNLTMTGGELQLAKNGTALPEITGTYTLSAGKVTLDGGAQIIKSVSDAGTNYYDLEFAGTGIKTFSSDNVNVNNQLTLSLPSTLGNYVDTDTDTLYVYNSNNTSISRTGGHVVGYLSREVNATDIYAYPVGSNNSGGDTYYEPIEVTTNSFIGVTNIVAKFYDTAPNPTLVNNVFFTTLLGNKDTLLAIETEGYWHLHHNSSLDGGNYTASVSPSSYWTMTKTWGIGHYALLKQDALAQPWDFTNGGIRTDDSTTRAFSNFSNYALAYTDSILPDITLSINWVTLNGNVTSLGNMIDWRLNVSFNVDYFNLERSDDNVNFTAITKIQSWENTDQEYSSLDAKPFPSTYYRLKMIDTEGNVYYSHVINLERYTDADFHIYPNPATHVLNIASSSENGYTLMMYNAVGKVVKMHSGVRYSTLDISDLPSGMYQVTFISDGISKSQKLLIRK